MSEWDDEEVESGASNLVAVAVAIAVLAVLGGIAFVVLRVMRSAEAQTAQSESNVQRQRQGPEEAQRGGEGGRATAAGRMQQRLRRRREAAAAAADEGARDGSDQEGFDPWRDEERRGADRVGARGPQEAVQGNRMSKQQAYDERRRAKDAAREAEEEALAAEVARLDAERAAAEAAEAEKWMVQISLEGGGLGAEDEEAGKAMLEDFLGFIKERKTVALDELAAHFGLRTQEAITRVQTLEADGRLTGVMDDRGKFIYISPAEMEAVAAFIKQRGRVPIAELAARSDELIDLEARTAADDATAAQDLFGDDNDTPAAAASA